LEGSENSFVPLKKRILEVVDDIIKRISNNSCIIIQGTIASSNFSITRLTLLGEVENPFVDSIISVLVQLKIDAYFRNVAGFVYLLKKDWFVKGYDMTTFVLICFVCLFVFFLVLCFVSLHF
jgi:hypothetical protein